MDREVQKAVNAQIGTELASAYAYLDFSAQFEEQSYAGFARWMRAQAQEELTHAMRFFDHLLERGGHVDLRDVARPAIGHGTPLEVFEAALAQEQAVTASINRLYALARERQDYAIEPLLQWFVTEQIEEEASVGLAVEQLRRAAGDPPTLLLLDGRFGERTAE